MDQSGIVVPLPSPLQHRHPRRGHSASHAAIPAAVKRGAPQNDVGSGTYGKTGGRVGDGEGEKEVIGRGKRGGRTVKAWDNEPVGAAGVMHLVPGMRKMDRKGVKKNGVVVSAGCVGSCWVSPGGWGVLGGVGGWGGAHFVGRAVGASMEGERGRYG